MANTKVTPHVMRSPALLASLINQQAGSTIVDRFGTLDPARAEKQINTWTAVNNFRPNGPLSRGITDSSWTPDQFSAACGLG